MRSWSPWRRPGGHVFSASSRQSLPRMGCAVQALQPETGTCACLQAPVESIGQRPLCCQQKPGTSRNPEAPRDPETLGILQEPGAPGALVAGTQTPGPGSPSPGFWPPDHGAKRALTGTRTSNRDFVHWPRALALERGFGEGLGAGAWAVGRVQEQSAGGFARGLRCQAQGSLCRDGCNLIRMRF